MINHEAGDKKSIKQQRVCSYFVAAAKGIILTEGVENVSVRKVADRAGYAFSTIYKHYKDLDALLLDVKTSLIGDLLIYMQTAMPATVTSLDDVRKINRLYAAYFIKYPHVFRFFYSYRLDPEPTREVALPDFSEYWLSTYKAFVDNGSLRPEDIPILAKTIIYSLHGLIALYFAGYGMTEDSLFADLDNIADFLLGGKISR